MPDRREQGFTLIEMIIVLVVLGLAAALVISRAPRAGGTIELRGSATRLVQGLRATRAEAIALGRPVLFGVDGGRHLYQVGTDAPMTLPADLALSVKVGGAAARGILFQPDGSTTGGVVLVATPARRMAVTVDWLSGHVSVGEPARDAP